MTFNDNARLDTSKVSKRGRNTAIAGGGGAVVVVGLFILSQLLGVDLTGLVGGGGVGGSSSSQEVALDCETGADANERTDCLVVGASNSLDDYWAEASPAVLGAAYRSPADVNLFSQGISTGCGQASSATGPFYCPADEQIYVDPSFFEQLRTQFGASGGSLAQMYVIAHEWGHHIQKVTGVFDRTDRGGSGPASDSVRTELQADCYAGAWAKFASTTEDASGQALLKPFTDEQIADALNAASVIGDDRIQEQSSGQVDPDTWTHGSSASRQKWFTAGLDGGPQACDTFAVSASEL